MKPRGEDWDDKMAEEIDVKNGSMKTQENQRDYSDKSQSNDERDALENADDPNTNEERIRVDRRKLELLLQVGIKEGEVSAASGEEFFQKIQEATQTSISWPSRLKIGAKSKKDPHIKVVGLPADIKKARQMILSVLDSKTSRVTLKMDVSFTDHSHIIGRGGNCIKKVMQDTGCHIHFPDSNRTSSDKSNQVSIAGPPHGVEAARKQIRELLPIVLMFEIPQNTTVAPDSTSSAIHSIAQKHNVTITFKQRPRAFGFIGTVRGLHSDPMLVRDAVLRVLEHLTGTMPVTVLVTTQIEIDCKHHTFIMGRNGCNIKQIMQNTGASIQFPDQNCLQGKKSTVYITGTIESTITAKVQLMDCLPLVLMFDVKEEEDDFVSDPRIVNRLVEDLDVLINVKPKPRQGSRSVIVKSIEKNAQNMYLTRCHLIKEDLNLMPLVTPLIHAPIMPVPSHFFSSQRMGIPMPGNEFPTALLNSGMNGKFIPTSLNAGINEKINTSPLGSPLQSSSTSPLPLRHDNSPTHRPTNNAIGNYGITQPAGNPQMQKLLSKKPVPHSIADRFSGSDLVRTLSVDSLFKPDVTSTTDGIRGSNSTGHLTIVESGKKHSPPGNDAILRAGNQNDLLVSRESSGNSFADALISRRFSNDVKEKLPGAIGTRLQTSNGLDASQPLPLNGSWNASKQTIAMLGGVKNAPFSANDTVSPDSNLSDSQSELSMSGSLSQTSNLIDRLALRKKKYNIADYELKRQMASKAITNETDYEQIRTPTGTWSGFGFSKSMPGSAIKELWVKSNRAQMNKYPLVENFQHTSPSQSLNSSASSNVSNHSNMSNTSSSSSSSFSGPESPARRKPSNGPPPGLQGPTMENAALLLNNNNFTSVFSNDSSLGTLAAVTDLRELFNRLGLVRYAEVFQEQEVDLNTFMTLSDDDLKELGVATFGARRRMVLAIHDLKKIHGQRDLPIPSPQSQTASPPMNLMGQRCMPIDLASSSWQW